MDEKMLKRLVGGIVIVFAVVASGAIYYI